MMWTHGVTLLLALGAVCAFDAGRVKERLTQFRIRSQKLHADALEREVEELEHEFDQLSAPTNKADVNKVKARLENLEDLTGTVCGEYEFSCGGQHSQCISHLFVCDGHKECINGHDEDEEVCSMDLIRQGSTFRGILSYRETDQVSLLLIVSSRRTGFGPLAEMRATLITRLPEDEMNIYYYPAAGYYSFGQRKMTLRYEDRRFHQLIFTCVFHHEDSDHLECLEETPYKVGIAWHRYIRA